MIKLDSIDLRGERCSGVAQLAKTSSASGIPSDILVLGEHRFTILSVGKHTRDAPVDKAREGRIALVEKSANGGELDVIGIEQALARMENGNAAKRKLF